MPERFEFQYHGIMITATVEIAFRQMTKPCANCGADTDYVSRPYVEKVLELQEDGGVIVPIQDVPLKRVRKEATERLHFKSLCNDCVAKETQLYI